jgi:hypothetical protein
VSRRLAAECAFANEQLVVGGTGQALFVDGNAATGFAGHDRVALIEVPTPVGSSFEVSLAGCIVPVVPDLRDVGFTGALATESSQGAAVGVGVGRGRIPGGFVPCVD